MKNFNKYLIILIILIAAFLRIWKLGSNPPHLSPDEAALGYNAYSILKTGRDEYGKILPVIFKSFGDYKPGLYVYLTVPFVATLGLNEFAVRLPSALLGVLGVWFLFLIIKEIKSFEKIKIRNLEIISALMLAINPWHIHFSRGAWEINVALSLTLAGILLFLKSLKNIKYFIPSSIAFALTLLTYQGAKLSTLIVVITLGVVFIKELLKLIKSNVKVAIVSVFIFFIISLPIILSIFQGKVGRLEVFSIFSYPRPYEYLQEFLKQGNEKTGSFSYNLFHSEGLNFARGVMGRYFNHFGGRFLFFEGDYQNPKHSSPNNGMMLFSDLVFIFFGIFALIKTNSKLSKFVFFWLILSPLPAALTRDQVQAVRAYNMVIPLILITSCGFLSVIDKAKDLKGILRNISFGFLVLLCFFSYVYFMDSYFVHLPVHNAKYWNYRYKQVIKEITPIQGNYKDILFQQSYDQPYIYFLFFQKYDPSEYQKQAHLLENRFGDVGLVENLDNVQFLGWSWPYATGEKDTLIIGNDVAIPSGWSRKDYNLVSEIKYPDNFMTAFRILETK